MKLRNKKTGEVVKLVGLSVYHERLFYELEDERGIFKREINSLSELNGEWEDYKIKEPLIKDEKIRKAVRVWADANGLDKAYYSADYVRFADDPDFTISIDFYRYIPNIANERTYTIEALCGEEEE